MDSAQDRDLAPIFRNFSQSEKLSEIKPPLLLTYMCTFFDSYFFLEMFALLNNNILSTTEAHVNNP